MRAIKGFLHRADSGQLLIGVLVVMLLMAIMVPAMVMLTQREARWTEKQAKSTTAFHLAEAGIEKGYRAISLSTSTWYALVDNGTSIDDFKFDRVFTDVDGGDYMVFVASGPEGRQATVYSFGRAQYGTKTQIRGIKAVFAQFSDEVAISAQSGVTVSGKVVVHWGSVISQQTIVTDGRTSPQFKSAAGIDVDGDGPGGVNCGPPDDGVRSCCQWYSYSDDLPEDTGVNTGQYKLDAQANTCTPAGVEPAGSCYYKGDTAWTTFQSGGGNAVFVEGNLTVSQRLNIVGDLIVMGSLNVPNGVWGDGDVDMIVPQIAWKQYCNNWTDYRTTFDPVDAPAGWPGLDYGYKSNATLNYQPVNKKTAVEGLLYIGQNLNASGGGGGNTRIYGTLYVEGSVTMDTGSQVTVYYNRAAAEAIKTLKLNLKRVEWQAYKNDPPF
ncbi:MAG: hypothetical protein ABIJ96_11910 [Elusimicrobiota bacterium]